MKKKPIVATKCGITWDKNRVNSRQLRADTIKQEVDDSLKRLGVDVSAEHFYTSAMATAAFLASQKPNGAAFVLGESGLTEALHQVGYVLTDNEPAPTGVA